MPRDSRIDANGTYARPSTESYGRRSYGGEVSGSRSGSYERTRPQSTYDRGGAAYQPRSGSAGGYSGRSYAAPRSGSSGGYGGSAGRAPMGGGGSRGMSGGGGGARGGGYRGR
jgi:hypothetical protein